jgi:hypothetical protein
MSLNKRTRGKTQFSTPFFFADTSSTTGGGLSGVTSASGGLVMEYRRQGQSTWTSVTPQTGKTLGSYLSGGIVADGALAGAYEVDFPDAAFASAAGVEWVQLRVRGATNMLATISVIELDAVDYQDAAAFGLSKFADIETDTQDIRNRLPAALVEGRIVAVAQSVTDKSGYSLTVTPPTASDIADAVLSESVDDHDGVAHSLAKYISIIKKGNTVIDGTVTSAVSPTSTAFTSNVNYPTGAFKHAVLLWVTGNLAEQNSPILTYNNTNGAITVEEAFTAAPQAGDEFVIIPATHVHSVAAISQGVWSNAGRTLSSFDFQVVVGGYAAGQAPLQSLGANAPAGWINAASIATDAITNEKIAASAVTKISTGVSNLEVLTRLASMIESDGAGQFRFDTIAVSLAVSGGAGGAVNITVEDRSITVT